MDKKRVYSGEAGKEKNAGQKQKKSLCPVTGKCGGCQYVDMPYKAQLKRKQKQAEMLLKEYGKVKPIIGMEEPSHYRNKVHAVFAFQKGRGIVSGIYQEKSHRVVPVENCLLEDQKAGEIIRSVRELAKSFKLKAYDEDSGYGLLRHVLVRVGHITGEIMVVLVLGSPILPSKKNFVNELCKLHPEITTILINVNNKRTSMVLGEKEQVIYGKGYIEDELCGRRFKISAKSFYQVNSVQTEALYAKAAEYAQLTGKEMVVDAYCGIGTIALAVAGQAGKVIGVELNKDAVRDAVTNAKINQIKNADFYQNDAGHFLTQMADAGEKVDVVFMDPPRSGSTEEFLDALIRICPKRIVYISCEPETLARDLKYLTRKSGYRVREITPVDMFPFTGHVETVALLSLKNDTPKIEVTMEVTADSNYRPKEKATYQNIKKYVKDNFGVNVHTRYIAEVKRMCGLEMGENHHKSQKENPEIKHCPPAKMMYIEDALKYFGLI